MNTDVAAPRANPRLSAIMGGRDKPGHDGREPGKGLERGEMAGLVSFAVLVSFVSLFLPFD